MIKQKLIDRRVYKGYTQKEVADMLCINVANYNRREKGLTKISNLQWQKLATFLEIPISEIYEDDALYHNYIEKLSLVVDNLQELITFLKANNPQFLDKNT